jgi:hypothetical protein
VEQQRRPVRASLAAELHGQTTSFRLFAATRTVCAGDAVYNDGHRRRRAPASRSPALSAGGGGVVDDADHHGVAGEPAQALTSRPCRDSWGMRRRT